MSSSKDDPTEVAQNLLPEAVNLRAELASTVARFEAEAAENHLQSPVRNLALQVSRLLQSGATDVAGVSDLIQLLTLQAFAHRAEHIASAVGATDPDENVRALGRLFRNMAHGPDAAPVLFRRFCDSVSRAAIGIVFTAHPTFPISRDLTVILARLASARAAKERQNCLKSAAGRNHGSAAPITLHDEMDFALLAIANARGALRRVMAVLLDVARDVYPDSWQELVPRLMTVATWVGYDLDGRSDIGWPDTLKMRMRVARLAVADYGAALPGLAALDDVRESLRRTEAQLDRDLAALDGDMEDVDTVGAFSRALVADAPTRLTDLVWAMERLGEEIGSAGEHDVALALLRAEMANFGLAVAHTHVRINANQLANAIRGEMDLPTSPEDPANRRRYLREISTLLDRVTPVTVNFGSVMRERASAKRLMMLLAQLFKFVDRDEPVRFLIAECNSAFTVLAALYLAKLFGIEERIDLSPLFETSYALEHGHVIVDELLENPHFAETVRRRGRLCIQTGYSDAGRYVGQIPATLAIERTRIKLASVLAARNLGDVELIIFDTHGESIGRGAHPKGFPQRLDYIYPPGARAAFRNASVRVKQEVSFQGGDGYAFFATPDLAFATLCRMLEHSLSPTEDTGAPDPFYSDTDYSLEFFLAIKGFNEELMDDPDYAATLDVFGANLLYPTGSRSMRRQHEGGGQVDLDHPSQLRAIPHNAILQQLGYLSNSISGLGRAISRDQDRFAEMWRRSNRLDSVISLAVAARRLSNLDMLHGYASLFDPAIWIRRAAIENDPVRETRMRQLARILRHSSRHEKMNRVYRRFLDDTGRLDRAIASHAPDTEDKEMRLLLSLLHGVRLALIHELFLLVAALPRFSNQAVSADDVINELLRLNVEHGVAALRRGFPVAEPPPDAEAFGEAASYRADADQGYAREHRELFDPIERLYDMIRRTGTAIIHVMGAVG